MAKDHAILFYTGDFLNGCTCLTMEERGQYITILCLQHQTGHLSEKTIRLSVGSISVDVLKKLSKDSEGNYYHERMDYEMQKRAQFIETRTVNGKKGGRPKKPSAKPNGKPKKKLSEDRNENRINIEFEDFWDLYSKKVGSKNDCERKWGSLKDEERQSIIDILPQYKKQFNDIQFQPFPSTFLNQRRWENEIIIPTNKGTLNTTLSYDEILKLSEKNPDIWKQYTSVKRDGERKAVFILKS